ncbi:MAG TPA: hypothetical protein VKU00_13915, partial [Chthonomonadaceae bacterium]|nr:hypothetical protein [Chthonomonadaceae bacterium]
DHFITQNVNLQSGGLRLHADYQDIGKAFSGFQALKTGNANNKALLDQLTQMEGEKGIRRTGFGLSTTPDPKSKAPTGMAFDVSQIQDAKGAIRQEALGYAGRNFHLNYASRDISEGFSQFTGLREADKAQWAHEKGMKTTNLGFGMNFGNGGKKGSQPGVLDFGQQSFGDKSGALSRQTLSLASGKFGFQMLDRKADKGFKRINDLSDADKTALALDLYHQFDPTAKATSVTAADKAQVAKEAGFARSGLRADMNWGKGGGMNFSQFRVADTPASGNAVAPGLERENLALNSKRWSLSYTQRRMDAGFTRTGDLSDVERNYLALDIRRQFDPNATLGLVTQKERDQLAKESGLQRSALLGQFQAGKGSQFTLSRLTLQDANHASPADSGVQRETLAFTSKNLQFSLLDQSISSGFNRLADLNDVERAQYANERGLTRLQTSLLWQVNKYTKFTYKGLRYDSTADSVAAAYTDAQKQNQDAQAAAKAASLSLLRQNLAFETKGFTLNANQSDTSKNFNRAADLTVPAADRPSIEADRGFKRTDLTTKLTSLKGFVLDGFFLNAEDPEDQLKHDAHRVNAQYTQGKRTAFNLLDESDMLGATGKINGTAHSLLTLNEQIGKGFMLNLLHEDNTTLSNGAETVDTHTDFLHFETPKQKPNSLMFETKHVTMKDDIHENTTNLNVHVKPNRDLTFAYTRLEVDHGDDNPADKSDPTKKDTVETTDTFDLQWQATKKFAVILGSSQRDTTDNTNADTVSVGMQGDPVRNVTMTAKFDEVHNTKNTKDVADFSLCNAKPFSFGPIQNLTITARYASLNDQRKLQNETMTGHAAWKIWKNEFVLDYGGITKPDGTSTITRLYSFTTDPNPKKAFHGFFMYKVRTLADGQDQLIRRFTADWRLSKRSNFVYSYGTLPEDDKGNIKPLESADIAFKHAFRPDKTFQFFYRLSNNLGTKALTRSLGIGYQGQLTRKIKIGLDYSKDTNMLGGKYDRSDHLRLAYDQQVSPNHFITISTDLRSHDHIGLTNEVQTNMDFRSNF